MKVIDNFLPYNYFYNLRNFMMGVNFDWHYIPFITNQKEIDDVTKSQFVHMFYHKDDGEGNFFPMLIPCLQKMKCKDLIRIKANLTPYSKNDIVYGYHTDLDTEEFEVNTSILYINTNNGYTLFEDGTRVDSIENRLVTFDSQMKHSGVSCSDEKCRIVINFNYIT